MVDGLVEETISGDLTGAFTLSPGHSYSVLILAGTDVRSGFVSVPDAGSTILYSLPGFGPLGCRSIFKSRPR
jgi:hypothetical protein